MAERIPITEEQLDALREQAAQNARVDNDGLVPISGTLPKTAGASSYHGNPVLKPPTWTWQVPAYFFLGGVAGFSSFIALLGHLIHNSGLTRTSSWVGLVGGMISAPLLIADLGRPARFLNMLRVFKPRSAMSLGAWTLAAFTSAVGVAVLSQEFNLQGYGNSFSVIVEWVAQLVAALTGLILASYTSVLVSVTAIPVWSENRKLVPAVFLTGALGSAAAMLELLGFTITPTQFVGIVASTVEIVIAIVIEVRGRYVDRPLREGAAGFLIRAGATLSGPASLLLRTVWGHLPEFRYAAAVCFTAGALIARYGWIGAGQASSRDPQALFQIQRREQRVLH